MYRYDSIERKKHDDFLFQLGDKMSQIDDTVVRKGIDEVNKKLDEKDLDFICKNGSSYYSFWFFRKNLVQNSYITNSNLLIHVFDSIFPNTFKFSEEGNDIRKILEGRLTVEKNKIAPIFISKDVAGKQISLTNYHGKKLVLLNFWATWCSPCMKEISSIKSIQEQYFPKELEIISISYPTDYSMFKKVLKEKKMDWINIYNDNSVINKYGGYTSIPKTFLIDKTGTIIYEKTSSDSDDLQLSRLQQILKNVLRN
jgi:peroxiredoxin